MLITKLYVNYFGKFTGREIELKPGVNLIYGDNEAGKSTLHTFIKGMLFGIERLRGRGAASKDDIYTRYLPWAYPGAYGGQMDLMLGDRPYRLIRSFHANDKSFEIIDLITGREIKLKEGHISELIPGLNESLYRNTISIEQLRAETDAELASQIRNYETNLSIAKSREVNVEKAVRLLKEKKKDLESVPYAAQLNLLSEEIKAGEDREAKIDFLTASLKDLKNKEKYLSERISNYKSPSNQQKDKLADELPVILEKYRIYLELSKQYSQLNSQVEELRDSLIEQEKYLEDLDKKLEENMKGLGSKRFLYPALSFLIGGLSFFLTKSPIVAISATVILLIISVIILATTNKRTTAISNAEHIRASMELEHGYKQLEELSHRRKGLEDDCDGLHDTIMLFMQEFTSEDELTYEAVARLKETIENKKREAARKQKEYNELLEKYRLQIEKIGWELSALEDNETELIKNKEQYEYLSQKQKENKLELDAINLALDTIQELSVTIHDSFGRQLNEEVSKIVSAITNHRYQDIKIDEKLNVKLEWNDNYILLDRLSAGTIDQVYFALRLAVSDLLLGEEPMPLILDDSFALYDDSRVKAALAKMANRSQLILFSCQTREKQLLEELGLDFNYIEL